MDIRLLVETPPTLLPYLMSKVKQSVNDGRRYRSKAEPIAQDEGRREKERAIVVILFLIESPAGRNYPRDIIVVSSVIITITRRDGQEA